MPDFHQQTNDIAALREKRRGCEEQYDQARLALAKTEARLRRAAQGAFSAPPDTAMIEALKTQIARMEAQIAQINTQLDALNQVFLKVAENDRLIIFLRQSMDALQRSAQETEALIAKLKNLLPPPLDQIAELEKKLAALKEQLLKTQTDLAAAEKERETLTAESRRAQERIARLNEDKKQITARIEELETKLSDLQAPIFDDQTAIIEKQIRLKQEVINNKAILDLSDKNLNGAIAQIYIDPHPKNALSRLDDHTPFLLFPVRIETKFYFLARTPELWVRIYPDDIQVNTHEKTLTHKEATAGQLYWTEMLVAEYLHTLKESRRKAAWIHIVGLFGPQRSAWVAKQTKPTDWSALSSAATGSGLIKILNATDPSFFIQLADSVVIETVKKNLQDVLNRNDDDAFIQLSEAQNWNALINQTIVKLISSFPPQPTTKTTAWSRAPRSYTMPDKFVLRLYEQGKLVIESVGNLIPDVLYLGPDPLDADAAFALINDNLVASGNYEWTTNFEKAIALGMGFKIPITIEQSKNGFDKIIALGLFLSAGKDESAKAVEELIDNHHYSRKGFTLVPNGSPAHNIQSDGSGFTTNDSFSDLSYFVETGDPLFQPNEPTDGKRLCDALGIGYAPLQYIRHSDQKDFEEAKAMNKALYPATLGYYFQTLLPALLPELAQDRLRTFFTDYIVGRGPFLSVRVGNQPYGILPTSDFSKWVYEDQSGDGVFNRTFAWQNETPFLRKLHEIILYLQKNFWEPIVGGLNYVGKPNVDPSTAMMDILGLQPDSVEFYQRVGYSLEHLVNQTAFQYNGRYANDVANLKNDAILFQVWFKQFGYAPKSGDHAAQLFQILYQHFTNSLNAANLIENKPLSETNKLTKNYIERLAAAATTAQLEAQNFGADPIPTSLLYMFMRNALLLNLYEGAYSWLNNRSNFEYTTPYAAKNIIGVREQNHIANWDVLHAKVGLVASNTPLNNMSVGDFLLANAGMESESAYLQEMKNALKILTGTPTARLERAFVEHLDCCSYRLDAWETALFTQRLESLRGVNADGARGVFIGAFGWLENLRPTAKSQIPADTLPPKLRPKDQTPVYEYADNAGFMHAPSINHASAGAFLLSGYKSHATPADPEMLAVNLSSSRVRRAMFLLEGMRNGQAIEALLGYQFERGLHDRSSKDHSLNLNQYILNYRQAFPVQQKQIPQPGTPAQETFTAYSVANGLKLSETALTAPNYGMTIAPPQLAPSPAEASAILAEIDQLKDSLDAVKDLLTAENAYQLVMGNFDRVAAVSLSQKEAHIPAEIEVVKSPRGSQFTFTNRVTLHFDNLDYNDPASNPWKPAPMTPKAQAEPGVNRWAGGLLGAPEKIVCSVLWLEIIKQPDGAETRVEHDKRVFQLSELALQPIDWLYITGNKIDGGATELELRIAAKYRETQALPLSTLVKIAFDEPKGGVGVKTIAEIHPLLIRIKNALTESRPLDAQDFMPASKNTQPLDPNNPKGYDAAELKQRTRSALNTLQALTTTLNALPIKLTLATTNKGFATSQTFDFTIGEAFSKLNDLKTGFTDANVVTFIFGNAEIASLITTLSQISLFGVSGAFPKANGFADPVKTALLDQAKSVSRILQDGKTGILDRASAFIAAADLETVIANQVAQLISAVKLLLGGGFNILTKFMYNNPADIALSKNDVAQLLTFAATESGIAAEEVVSEWVESVARVRPKMYDWEMVRTLADAVSDASIISEVVQLPFRTKDSWLAVEFPKSDPQDPAKPFQIVGDTLSVIVHGAAAFKTSNKQSGVLLDDWLEDIPTDQETTGISFHYNRPNAFPPQTILLAVAPKLTGSWSWDDLVSTLEDTLQRAKRRAVEPDTLEKNYTYNRLLPALVSEFTTTGVNFSLDLARNLEISAINELSLAKIKP